MDLMQMSWMQPHPLKKTIQVSFLGDFDSFEKNNFKATFGLSPFLHAHTAM